MKFDVLTLFPSMFESVLGDSIIGRAQNAGLLDLNFVQIRSFAANKHKSVDDYPYGGGEGMLMAVQPVYDAYRSVTDGLLYKPLTIYMSPKGRVFNQSIASELLKDEHIVLICGHYEGMDQRIIDEIVDMELSIGDFVLTGGEIPAMAVIDTVARMVDGVLAGKESYKKESHYNSLLEYPQYTRPYCFMGKKVPDVLLSGHHKNIESYKRYQSIRETYIKRPDMLKSAQLDKTDLRYLEEIKKDLR